MRTLTAALKKWIVTETGVLTLLVAASAVWLGFAVWTAYDNLQEHHISIAAGSRTTESSALAQALKTVSERHYPHIRITLLEIKEPAGLLDQGLVQLAAVPSDTPAGPNARSVAALTPQSLLLAHSDVDNRVVYALTQTLLQRRQELAEALNNAAFRPLAAQVQKPDVNSKSPMPLHPGAMAFYERDKTPFVRRYARLIVLVSVGLVLLGLWTWWWTWRRIRRTRLRRNMQRKLEERRLAELAAREPWSFSRLLMESAREAAPPMDSVAPVVAQTMANGKWQMANGKSAIRNPQSSSARPLDRQLLVSGAALGTTCAGSLAYPPLGVLTTPLIVYLEWPIFQAAWRDLREKRGVKIDGLMALFTTGAWLTRAYVSSAFSIFTLALSDKITSRTRDRSRQKLIEVFDQQPRTVRLWVAGREVETPFAAVQPGDSVVVHAGQIMPVDGVVSDGMATVDQQRLTGEARLVEKGVGDTVLAATLVVRGHLHVRVEKAGRETLASQIGEILNRTTSYHLTVEERGLALAEKSVLPSLLLSAGTLPFRGFSNAVAVLSAMPGVDMYYAGPLALLNCLHVATRHGILIKDGRSLELLHTIDTVILDKTGTLTLEQPEVAQVHVCGAFSADDVLLFAAAAERHQSHPIAQAILAAAQARNLSWPQSDETRFEVGYGVQVRVDGQMVSVGSERFMAQEGVALPPELAAVQQECAGAGHSLVYVAVEGALAGALELQPTLRPEAQAVIRELKQQKLTLYILSGDQTEPTRHLAEQLGIEHYFANVLPTEKAHFVEQLQQQGRKVCFVGDGINDAIALKQANVSISLRGATTIATDTAQIVLMDQSLHRLPQLFELAHRLERNLLTSFGLSIGTGSVIIGGALAFHMGVGAAMTFGSVALLGMVGNAMLPLLITMRKKAK
jgi:Cu2+-exporting ATPase